jgi:hypothetical protein
MDGFGRWESKTWHIDVTSTDPSATNQDFNRTGNMTLTPRWFEAGYVVLFLSMHDSSVFTVDEHVRSVLGAIGRIRALLAPNAKIVFVSIWVSDMWKRPSRFHFAPSLVRRLGFFRAQLQRTSPPSTSSSTRGRRHSRRGNDPSTEYTCFTRGRLPRPVDAIHADLEAMSPETARLGHVRNHTTL